MALLFFYQLNVSSDTCPVELEQSSCQLSKVISGSSNRQLARTLQYVRHLQN